MTDVDICNAALVKVGAEPIATLEDNSKRAKLCKLHYTRLKNELIVSHPWNFAIKRVTLEENGDTPAFEYAYAYDLPEDYLRIFRVAYGDDIDYKVEGKTILSQDQTFPMLYISETTEEMFSVYFTEALGHKVAVELSYSMVQSNELSERILKNYTDSLRNARLYDAQEGKPYAVDASDWTTIRQ